MTQEKGLYTAVSWLPKPEALQERKTCRSSLCQEWVDVRRRIHPAIYFISVVSELQRL